MPERSHNYPDPNRNPQSKQTEGLPTHVHPESQERSYSPEAHFGDILTAGNDERKLIMLAAMQPDTLYTPYGLYTLIREKQGDMPGFSRPDNTIPMYFAKYSLATRGLVEPSVSSDGATAGYTKTQLATDVADAYAGHMLALSEELPLSLRDYLGSSVSGQGGPHIIGGEEGQITEQQRTSPLSRFLIYEKILDLTARGENTLRSADIADATGLPISIAGAHLNTLGDAGIIDYASIEQDSPIVSFTFNPDQDKSRLTAFDDKPEMTHVVLDYFEEAANNGEDEIFCQTLVNRYFDDHPEAQQKRESVQKAFTAIANHLERSGFLVSDSFRKGRYSEITVTDDQRTAIEKIVTTVNQLRSGDETFLQQGEAQAHEILNDPQRVSNLIIKARERSPYIGPITAEIHQTRILEIISQDEGYLTSKSISEKLKELHGKAPGVAGVSYYLKRMRNEGIIPEGDYVSGSIYHYRGGQNTDTGPLPFGNTEGRVPPNPEAIARRKAREQEKEFEAAVENAVRYQPEPAEVFSQAEAKRAQLGVYIIDATETHAAPERQPEEVMHTILEAVGNSEHKALLLAGMDEDKIYGRSDLHMLVQTIIGSTEPEEFTGAEVQFCEKTLEPAGLVEKHTYVGRNGEVKTGYKKTALGAQAGAAVAGAVLTLSDQNEALSMQDYFGNVGSAVHRYKMFKSLLSDNPPSTRGELSAAVGIDPSPTGKHLQILDDKGVITYKSREMNKTYVLYGIREDAPTVSPEPYRNEVTLTRNVYNAAKSFSGEITSQSIQDALAAQDPENESLQTRKMKTRITKILSNLSVQGYLVKEEYSGRKQSNIAVSEDQQESITAIIQTIEGVQNGDSAVLADVRAKTKEILNDPARAAVILQKAKENNPLRRRVSIDVSMGQIQEIVVGNEAGMGLREIHAQLRERGSKLSLVRVANLLSQMRISGQIDAEKVGRAHRYKSLPSESSEPEIGNSSKASIAESEEDRENGDGAQMHHKTK